MRIAPVKMACVLVCACVCAAMLCLTLAILKEFYSTEDSCKSRLKGGKSKDSFLALEFKKKLLNN